MAEDEDRKCEPCKGLGRKNGMICGACGGSGKARKASEGQEGNGGTPELPDIPLPKTESPAPAAPSVPVRSHTPAPESTHYEPIGSGGGDGGGDDFDLLD